MLFRCCLFLYQHEALLRSFPTHEMHFVMGRELSTQLVYSEYSSVSFLGGVSLSSNQISKNVTPHPPLLLIDAEGLYHKSAPLNGCRGEMAADNVKLM